MRLLLILSTLLALTAPMASARGWFANATSAVIVSPPSGSRVSKEGGRATFDVGVMAGYLNNWGGYGRVAFVIPDLSDGPFYSPAVTAGVTKRLATFDIESRLYLYAGLGAAPVMLYQRDIPEHVYTPDGLEFAGYYDDWTYDYGLAVDAGVLWQFSKHFNVGIGYTLGLHADVSIYGGPAARTHTDHRVQFTMGYCF